MNTPSDLRSRYEPPTTDLSQPLEELPSLPPNQRSAAPKVFGILSIIFSSITILGSGIGLFSIVASKLIENIGNLAPDADKAAELSVALQPMAKVYQGIGLQSAILFVMSVLLLVIGIGQVRYRAWASRWSVYWGGAGLACVGLIVAISMLIISPAYAEFFDSLSRLKPQGEGQAAVESMGALSSIFGGTFAVISILFYAPYPALMLMFFTRDHVRASMTT